VYSNIQLLKNPTHSLTPPAKNPAGAHAQNRSFQIRIRSAHPINQHDRTLASTEQYNNTYMQCKTTVSTLTTAVTIHRVTQKVHP